MENLDNGRPSTPPPLLPSLSDNPPLPLLLPQIDVNLDDQSSPSSSTLHQKIIDLQLIIEDKNNLISSLQLRNIELESQLELLTTQNQNLQSINKTLQFS